MPALPAASDPAAPRGRARTSTQVCSGRHRAPRPSSPVARRHDSITASRPVCSPPCPADHASPRSRRNWVEPRLSEHNFGGALGAGFSSNTGRLCRHRGGWPVGCRGSSGPRHPPRSPSLGSVPAPRGDEGHATCAGAECHRMAEPAGAPRGHAQWGCAQWGRTLDAGRVRADPLQTQAGPTRGRSGQVGAQRWGVPRRPRHPGAQQGRLGQSRGRGAVS